VLTRPQALTTTYDGITRILQNKIHVSVAFDPSTHSKPINPQNCGAKEFLAIWDTGATGTAVNQSVIDECGLKQIGVVEVHTANEKRNSPVYLASIFLPNHVFIPFLRVHEATIKGADVLIGMDIITRGDFTVTNKDGKTVFSFRIPSTECIDFVKQSQGTVQPTSTIPKVSRNAPCPCGSGKKYKRCHGK
jgi:predicted aspartyl protease